MITIDFLSGGNVHFTIGNPAGVHYTYRVRKHKTADIFFVSLLTGPDNYTNYTYLGIYDPNTHTVRLTRASKYNDAGTPVRVLRWGVDIINRQAALPAGYTIQHDGKCCRCGRKLTVPESISSGIGPECAQRRAA